MDAIQIEGYEGLYGQLGQAGKPKKMNTFIERVRFENKIVGINLVKMNSKSYIFSQETKGSHYQQ